MSRSYPSRTPLTKRLTTLPASKAPTRNSKPGQAAPQPPIDERVTVNHTAFSVICPDPKKRDHILKQAAKEEKAYEDHRRSNRPSHVSMTPRRLGSLHESGEPTSLQETRRQQPSLVSSKGPFQAAEKARTARKQNNDEEEKRSELMKESARKQTERNRTKTEMNAEELRAKRLQFLGM